MRSQNIIAAAMAAASASAAAPRMAMYLDEWHTDNLPTDKSITAGVTHVITAFAKSDIFIDSSSYTPFMPISQVRAMFDDGVKVCMAIGGWGDTAGFSAACKEDSLRKAYAKNVAAALDAQGYDCIDVDWEYPGGNGEDYKQNLNSGKVNEIDDYPLLLKEIKAAIGDKELSIAVPGKPKDMIAFTKDKVPEIDAIVDVVNVMAYDLLNRRDNTTHHHSSITGTLRAVDAYLQNGMTPAKMNLGIAFYAKWFTTADGDTCEEAIGCPLAELEDASGTDTGKSGAVTFEPANTGMYSPILENGKVDTKYGGTWYWDSATKKFWTWDTPEMVARKFDEIVKAKGLGGVMAWSLGEDTADWSLLKAMQTGIKSMT